MEIVLASQSPRRQELLARLGLTFTVQAADLDETMDPSRPPAAERGREKTKWRKICGFFLTKPERGL